MCICTSYDVVPGNEIINSKTRGSAAKMKESIAIFMLLYVLT